MHIGELIGKLTDAIGRQEGMGPLYANPGNLRAAPWLKNVDTNKGFWVPKNRREGLAGLAHVIALHIAMGHSLRQFISSYAPPSDHNDTEAYIRHVSAWTGIPDNANPMWFLVDAVEQPEPSPEDLEKSVG